MAGSGGEGKDVQLIRRQRNRNNLGTKGQSGKYIDIFLIRSDGDNRNGMVVETAGSPRRNG